MMQIRKLRLTPRSWSLLIFSVALCVRLTIAAAIQLRHPELVYHGEAENIARTLATTGEFAGAYAIPTGPTAHCAPFYPALLSVVYRVLGTGAAGEWGRVVLLITVTSLSYALLPLVALELGLPLWCGAGAGLLCALFPMHRTADLTLAWAEPYAALGLMGALCLWASWTRLREGRRSALVGYGAFWGLLLYVAATLLPVLLGLVVADVCRHRGQRQLRLRRWLPVLLTAALCVVPWTLRNRVRLGGWIFMRSNFGIEFQMANNDLAGPTMNDLDQSGLARKTHPYLNSKEAERVRELGEIAYNRERVRRALDWVKAHPRRFLQLTSARALDFWFGSYQEPGTAWVFTLTTLFAGLGAMRLRRDGKHEVLWYFGPVWICFPAVYYIVQYLPRYRIPMWWTVLLVAVYGAGRLMGKPPGQTGPPTAG
jgi:hypothetical protein